MTPSKDHGTSNNTAQIDAVMTPAQTDALSGPERLQGDAPLELFSPLNHGMDPSPTRPTINVASEALFEEGYDSDGDAGPTGTWSENEDNNIEGGGEIVLPSEGPVQQQQKLNQVSTMNQDEPTHNSTSTTEDFSRMTVAQLKEQLRSRGLQVNGNRGVLVERLQLAVGLNAQRGT